MSNQTTMQIFKFYQWFNQNTRPILKFNQWSTRTQCQYSNSTKYQPEHHANIPIQPIVKQNTMSVFQFNQIIKQNSMPIFLFNQLSNRTLCQYSNSTKLLNKTPCQYSNSTSCQTEHHVSIPIQPIVKQNTMSVFQFN